MKSNVFTVFFGALGALLVVLGYLFKIQHWPYGMEMLLIGKIIIVLVVLYALYVSRHKKKD